MRDYILFLKNLKIDQNTKEEFIYPLVTISGIVTLVCTIITIIALTIKSLIK